MEPFLCIFDHFARFLKARILKQELFGPGVPLTCYSIVGCEDLKNHVILAAAQLSIFST